MKLSVDLDISVLKRLNFPGDSSGAEIHEGN